MSIKNFAGNNTDEHMGHWKIVAISGNGGDNVIIAIDVDNKKSWKKDDEKLFVIGRDKRATFNYLKALCCDPESWGIMANYNDSLKEIEQGEVMMEIETVV